MTKSQSRQHDRLDFCSSHRKLQMGEGVSGYKWDAKKRGKEHEHAMFWGSRLGVRLFTIVEGATELFHGNLTDMLEPVLCSGSSKTRFGFFDCRT